MESEQRIGWREVPWRQSTGRTARIGESLRGDMETKCSGDFLVSMTRKKKLILMRMPTNGGYGVSTGYHL